MRQKPTPGMTVVINMADAWTQQDATWEDAEVLDLLNTQFTYKLGDGREGFVFYAHYGDTWRWGTI